MRFGPFPITERGPFPPPSTHECWVYVTLNADIALSLAQNEGLQELIDSQRLRVSIDGQWIWWALRRKYPGTPLRKLSGSDLIYSIAAHCAAQRMRLLLLGSTAEINARAVARLLVRWPELDVVGHAPGHCDLHESSAAGNGWRNDLLATIGTVKPDYVVLGLGAPKEHRFAADALPALDGSVRGLLCFGGAIDMLSGVVKRAPQRVQDSGLESLYRLWQQPSRLRRTLRMLRILPTLARGDY